jgi:hypothetical protein
MPRILSCSDPLAHGTSTGHAPSRHAATVSLRQKLKSCHQARDRRINASGSRQRPRAPRGNSVADKDATPVEG